MNGVSLLNCKKSVLFRLIWYPWTAIVGIRPPSPPPRGNAADDSGGDIPGRLVYGGKV